MTEPISQKPSAIISLNDFGSRDEIKELADRLQLMIPGAQRLNQPEALTLAQVAIAHKLDPFNGEVWLLKSEKDGVAKYAGTMIGIKGLRKLARRQLGEADDFWTNFFPEAPDKVLASGDPKIGKAVCWRCEVRDSKTLRQWTERMKQIQQGLGVDYQVARDIVGPAPIFIGYGVAYGDEYSKMNLHDRARKRAEASALRQRFDVGFSYGEQDDAEAAEEELVTEVIEGEVSEPQSGNGKTTDQMVLELGYSK